MAHRTFQDPAGRTWNVWSVVPERADRRRDKAILPTDGDRRKRNELRVRLGDRWTNGWLAFQTEGERRRFAPIPENWEASDDAGLIRLWAAAELISALKRRLIE